MHLDWIQENTVQKQIGVWTLFTQRKITEIEKKLANHNHDKYVTTPEFYKLTVEDLL